MKKICWKTKNRSGEYPMEDSDAEEWMNKYENCNPDVKYSIENIL